MMFTVDTQTPIALNSPDHIKPLATRKDNSINLDFNRKIEKIVTARPILVLDLGCAGGGMVETFLADGHIAVGIEGSDFSYRHQRAAWATIPGNLFTADCTKPFSVYDDGAPALFDIVTAWEFFEHIRERDLLGVVDNIKRHLKPGGLLIGSINTKGMYRSMVYYHQTIWNRGPWLRFFASQGLEFCQDIYDVIHPDWVRQINLSSFCVVLRVKNGA